MTETTHRASRSRSGKAAKKGLLVERIFTTAGVHPYDEVTWERRDVVQNNWKTGEVGLVGYYGGFALWSEEGGLDSKTLSKAIARSLRKYAAPDDRYRLTMLHAQAAPCNLFFWKLAFNDASITHS
mgnify:CR=1 FL=1